MKYLKYILLLILLVLVAGAIYVATLENSYDIKRTKVIKAPTSLVFNTVNDYKSWPSWSPWLEKDTLSTLTYGEITSGKGAHYSWDSEHKDVGAGSMETIDTAPNASINQRMKMSRPWDSESDIYWGMKPVQGGTEVTWGMKGELGFIEKAFMAMGGGLDSQVGPDYEKGLDKLAAVIMAEMKKYKITVNGLTTYGGGYYLYNTTSCKMDQMASKMAEMMPKVGAYVQKNNISMAGAPFSLYHKFDPENNAVIFSCAVPVTERVITDSDSDLQTGLLRPFKAVKITLKGDYDNLKETWEMAYKHIADTGLEQVVGSPAIEVYHTDPMAVQNPADWITEIYIPVKD